MNDLLTAQEIAVKLGVKPHSVYELARQSPSNGFPVRRIGRWLRFNPDNVDAWTKTGGVPVGQAGRGHRNARSS